jgi:serine protease Do
MGALEELSAAIRGAAERVGPSVVSVNRQGSGLVVGKDLVLTNAHNLRGERAVVQFPDGREMIASVAGADVDGDLAVIQAETGDIPPIEWSDASPAIGDFVVALANPRGRGLKVTAGTVSSVGRSFRGPRGRRIPGGLEHTAPLGRGSSGGPVTDASGRVVGVNTHRLQEGFYLAVAANDELRQRISKLAAGEAPARRRLGAAIAPAQAARHLRAAAGLPEVDGLLIRGVEEGSPADRAGLRRGDVLTAAGEQALSTIDDLYALLDGEGDLELRVVRATDEVTVVVRFGEESSEAEGEAPASA